MPRSTSKRKQGSQSRQNAKGDPLNLKPISKQSQPSKVLDDDFSKKVKRSFTRYITAKGLLDRNRDKKRANLIVDEIKAWIKAENISPEKAQKISDIGSLLLITTKIKPEVFKNLLDDFGLPHPSLPIEKQEKLDVNTDSAVSLREQHPTEREEMPKEKNKGYSSVVGDQFTLAGTPRIRAPKGAGRKKKPISLTMYQSDIDDVTEAAKLLGYPNRTEYLETIIKKHAKRTLSELKNTP